MQRALQQEEAECARLRKEVEDNRAELAGLQQQRAQVHTAARLGRDPALKRTGLPAQADEEQAGRASSQQQPEQLQEAASRQAGRMREAGEVHAQPGALGDKGVTCLQQQLLHGREAASGLKRAPEEDSAGLQAQADADADWGQSLRMQHQPAQAELAAERQMQLLEAQKVRLCMKADANLLQCLPAWKCPEQCTRLSLT